MVPEHVSAGEGTHSAIIAEDGFVWHTGTNTNGELALGNNTAKNVFTKSGDTVLTTNFVKKYLDIGEKILVVAVLENTYNLKIDTIDNDQANFALNLNGHTNITNSDLLIEAVDYGNAKITLTHTPSGKQKELEICVAIKVDGIVQAVRDNNFVDGEYPIVVNNQEYLLEIKNYYDDVTYEVDSGATSKTISIGDNSTDYKMTVAKYHKNLTIRKGVTITAATAPDGLTYKKGMYVCVLGTLTNEGNITMTARGTYNCEGEDVYLWHNIDDSYEYVPAAGGAGGAGTAVRSVANTLPRAKGNAGENGTGRALGGGGSGGNSVWRNTTGLYCYTPAGASATSYSGGSGSGGLTTYSEAGSVSSGAPGENGGAGGNAHCLQLNVNMHEYAGGGAGNKAGVGKQSVRAVESNNSAYNVQNGTGGLLVLYADLLSNDGMISSDGSAGGSHPDGGSAGSSAGGSSGGGSVNIFAKEILKKGSYEANGGKNLYTDAAPGGNGGNGNVTFNLLGSVLNFKGNPMKIKVSTSEKINTSKLYYTKLNDIQTHDLSIGTLTYQSEDTSIATVDSLGNVTGVKKGRVRIKVTDTTNGYSTYVVVNVIDDADVTLPQIEEGESFTVALKSNGTVWTYGKNEKGQLGNNTEEDSNIPVQVVTVTGKGLENIVDIGAGTNSAIACDKDGHVYIWGLHKRKESEQDIEDNKKVATRITGIENIVKVESYNDKFYAIDRDGKVYAFGDTYSGIVEIDTDNIRMKDVDGDLLLSEDGFVYKVGMPTTKYADLYNIVKISKGTNSDAFVTNDGIIKTIGQNASGELGNGTNTNYLVNSTVVLKEDGSVLEDVYDVSMGANYAVAVTFDGEAYTWGNNNVFKIGLESSEKTILNATKITKVCDIEGNEIELKNMEIAEAGQNKGSLMDEEGYVYSVGQNTVGQLGTLDNETREIYTKISKKDILTKPEDMKIKQGETQDIIISSGNGFNLKSDINGAAKVEVVNTNPVKLNIEEIGGVDNSGITDASKMKNNFRIRGDKIGRCCLVVTDDTGFSKNIWVTVVNEEDAEVAAKVENGENFTIALRSNGEIYSFGQNASGECRYRRLNR